MAWNEYYTVRCSDLYEGKGLTKSILMMIALGIERAEDGEKPTENEGFAYFSQKYIAEALGCNESTVKNAIAQIAEDGWINIHTSRNAKGWTKNRYEITQPKLDLIVKRERKGHQRVKNPNMIREKRASIFVPKDGNPNRVAMATLCENNGNPIPPGSGQIAPGTEGNLRPGVRANSAEASGQFALKAVSSSFVEDFEKPADQIPNLLPEQTSKANPKTQATPEATVGAMYKAEAEAEITRKKELAKFLRDQAQAEFDESEPAPADRF